MIERYPRRIPLPTTVVIQSAVGSTRPYLAPSHISAHRPDADLSSAYRPTTDACGPPTGQGVGCTLIDGAHPAPRLGEGSMRGQARILNSPCRTCTCMHTAQGESMGFILCGAGGVGEQGKRRLARDDHDGELLTDYGRWQMED